MSLFRLAAQATHTPTPLADTFDQQFQAAIDDGKGTRDWAAGYLEQVREQSSAHATVTKKVTDGGVERA
jgi:hypothetical protein